MVRILEETIFLAYQLMLHFSFMFPLKRLHSFFFPISDKPLFFFNWPTHRMTLPAVAAIATAAAAAAADYKQQQEAR